MIRNSLTFLFFITFAVLFFDCSKTVVDDYQIDFGYDYFPLEIGKYRTYVVDSVLYDIGDNEEIIITNSQSYEMHLVADTIIDNLGRSGFKIERYERASDTLDWEIKDIWIALQTDQGAEWIEENLRFLKMAFPLKAGVEWDGNQYIDITTIIPIAGESVEIFKSWSYEALTTDENEAINDRVFENVATISQANSENLIELRYSQEKYAKGIGLVYREMKILDTQCIIPCENQTWEEKAEKGFILTQQIIDFN